MSSFTKGVTAYEAGEPFADNPFNAETPQGSLAWEWWREGWKFAQRQAMEQVKICEEKSVFAEGKAAFENDVPIENNPYDTYQESQEHNWAQWRKGWKEAYWHARDSSKGEE